MIQRKVDGLGMQHLAPHADVGHVTGGQHATDLLFGHHAVCEFDIPGKAIAARFRAREAGDDMVHPHIGHLLRRLHGGADGPFGFVHHRDFAELHPARACGRGPDDPELRLPRHRPDTIGFAHRIRPVKAQDQAGDLGGADVQNGHDAPLHRRAAHMAHGPLGLIEIGHSSLPLVSMPMALRRSLMA